MYAAIVAYLFPIYAAACLFALVINIFWVKEFLQVISYSILYGLFQFLITGQAAGLGYKTFLCCIVAQAFMGVIARIYSVKSSRLVYMASLAAITINLLAMTAFLLDHPIRQFYFVGINIVQTLQIGSLVWFSPLWPFLHGFVRRKPSKERSKPSWEQRAAIFGP